MPPVQEPDATVSVVGISGAEYPFTNIGNGRYVTSQLFLDPGQFYQLKVITRDGNEFRSGPSQVRISPLIDSTYWNPDSAGVHIYLNTHDPGDKAKYYRWENVETWEYLSAYFSSLEYIGVNNFAGRNLTNQIYRCYQTQVYPYIEVTNTTRLSADQVNKYEIIAIPTGSEKLSVVYTDLVRQYAISKEAFDFWQNLKKNTEQLGSLFDIQPFTELGNISCISNPSVKCIGFVSFSTLQKKRIFINKNEVSLWYYAPYYNVYEPCFIQSAYPEVIDQFFLPPGGPYGNSMIGSGLDSAHLMVYLFSTKLCVDCTVQGGSSVRPDYWP